MSIDKDTVKHISKLARISLDKLSIFLSSKEILANFDICITVSLSIDICDYRQISKENNI